MAARRKAAAQAAPRTIEEAIAAIARYREINAEIERQETIAEAVIAGVREQRDLQLAPLQAELGDIFAQLRAWWAVARDEVTGGKRRSAELAGIEIGERRAPPSLKLTKKMTVKAAIEKLKALIDGERFLRVKHELNRDALVAEVSAKPAGAIAELGFAVANDDEFYIAVRPVEQPPRIDPPD